MKTEDKIETPISIVIPLYNEEDSIDPLLEELLQSLDRNFTSYEVILVNDGSTDSTARKMDQAVARYKSLVAITLARNYGQTIAMQAGIDAAEGDIIVTMDGDLQNDPADIRRFVTIMQDEECDLVSGWRKDRHDGFLRVKISNFANWLISATVGVRLHDYGCTLKAYRTEVLRRVRIYGELHRFMPALISSVGGRVREEVTNHRARKFGRSKYSFDRIIRVSLDLILIYFMMKFLLRPLHVFGAIGAMSLIPGIIIGIYLTFSKIFMGEALADRPLLLLSVLLILSGVILIVQGILGEMIIRSLHESSSKLAYYVRSNSKSPGRIG